MTTKTVALALSSTGFKFPAHVGALQAIQQRGLEAIEISGSSGGALIGGLFFCGMSISELKAWAINTQWFKFFSSGLLSGGLVSLDKFEAHLKELTGNKCLGDVPGLHITACDINTHSMEVLNHETYPDMTVARAIRASISIPGVFSPVKHEGKTLLDGAIMNTLPLNLLKKEVDLRIGVRVTYSDRHTVPDTTSIPVIARRSLYMIVDRGNAWALPREGCSVVDIDTGFADGLDVFMSKEKRRLLMHTGNADLHTFLENSLHHK